MYRPICLIFVLLILCVGAGAVDWGEVVLSFFFGFLILAAVAVVAVVGLGAFFVLLMAL